MVARASTTSTGTLSEQAIAKEEKYGAHNYHPLPVVLEKAKGMRARCVGHKSWLPLPRAAWHTGCDYLADAALVPTTLCPHVAIAGCGVPPLVI